MNRPTVCTQNFRNVHGRAPRGTGNWWFCANGATFQTFGTFAQACRAARQHFAGATTVHVMP